MGSWQDELLQALGIPVTTANEQWLTNWAAAEEGQGAGFGPGAYSYYGNNPFNIKQNGSFANFSTPQAGIAGTAAWLQSNGNFGNLGTYAQEIQAYLTGGANNIGSSLAYFSGHSGNASLLTSSYQKLVGGQQYGSGGLAADSGQGATSVSSGGPGTGSGEGESGRGLLPNNIFGQIAAVGASSFIFIGAVALVVGGGLWIALTSKPGQTVVSTVKTVGKATA